MIRQEVSIPVAWEFPKYNEVRAIEGDLKVLPCGDLIDKKGRTWKPGTWSLTKEEAFLQVRLDLDVRRNALQDEITSATELRQKLDKLWENLK